MAFFCRRRERVIALRKINLVCFQNFILQKLSRRQLSSESLLLSSTRGNNLVTLRMLLSRSLHSRSGLALNYTMRTAASRALHNGAPHSAKLPSDRVVRDGEYKRREERWGAIIMHSRRCCTRRTFVPMKIEYDYRWLCAAEFCNGLFASLLERDVFPLKFRKRAAHVSAMCIQCVFIIFNTGLHFRDFISVSVTSLIKFSSI